MAFLTRQLIWGGVVAVILVALLSLHGNPTPAAATHSCASAGSPAGPFDLLAYEAADWRNKYGDAFEFAASNKLFPANPTFALPRIETGPRSSGSSSTANPYIPPVLLKAIAWIESSWQMADPSVDYGEIGPPKLSYSCAYGIMQVLSGMENTNNVPTLEQVSIGSHYGFNIAAGARILAEKWNYAPTYRPIVGSRNPALIEDWYYALWSYHGFAYVNHPKNPIYSPSRGVYSCNSQDSFNHNRSQFPYQELVLGCVAHPPVIEGTPLWNPQPVTLPNLSQPAFSLSDWNNCSGSFNCAGMDIPTPKPSHTDPTAASGSRSVAIGSPSLSVSPASVTLAAFPNVKSTPRSITISNAGTGPLAWRLSSSVPWLELSRTQGVSLGTDIGSRAASVTVRAKGLPPGIYIGQIAVESLYASGAPANISVTLQVAGDIPVPGDYKNDGKTDIAMWRPSDGTWYVRGQAPVRWGVEGDISVPGDYNGDGRTDMTLWRPSDGTWYARGQAPVRWGVEGDIPVPGDYNGDGKTNIAMWRPSNATWYVRGRAPVQWGLPGDVPVPGDYNGDGKTQMAIWRPSNGTWYVPGQPSVQWGVSEDMPVPGEYTGDGKTDMAVWRPSNGNWYVWGRPSVQWGVTGDVPVPGDYNGDGLTDRTVWRPSNGTWYVRSVASVQWGVTGDIPVPGDYDGDGKTQMALWRPSNGTWYVPGQASMQWGVTGDVPVPGDYNGDGKAQIALWRPSNGTWYVPGQAPVQWGLSGDVPVPGDYNGDGKADLAVWRPSNGTWYVRGRPPVQWGVSGDIPVPGDYNEDGKAQMAIWRPSNSTWYIPGGVPVQWGLSEDIPVPSGYDGDGKTQMALWRRSNGIWYVPNQAPVQWGLSGDIPVPGEYNGDSKTDRAVWRPTNATWYVYAIAKVQWGLPVT